MLKRIISAILVCAMAVSVTACSENNVVRYDDTLPQCEPANLPDASNFMRQCIMKGKEGFYYTDMVMLDNNTATRALCYYDMALGKSIMLCSKPQCMHDGNDFCVATGGGVYQFYSSLTCLYNGYIYRLGDGSTEEEKWQLSLLKTDLLGNELSKVADIGALTLIGEAPKPQIESAVFHNNKLFVAITPTMNKPETFLYAVDIASGGVSEITLPAPEEGTKKANFGACCYMTADGDWLYYTMRCVKDDSSHIYFAYDKTIMYRYNIKTGATEKLSALPDIYSSFTVADGIVYYTVVDTNKNNFTLYSYDVVNDETTTLAGKVQQNFLKGEQLSQDEKVTVVTDRKYLYVCTSGTEGNRYKENDNSLQDDIDFYIYDLEGNQLLHGLPGIDMTLDSFSYGFSAIDGEIYLNFSDNDMTSDGVKGLYRIKTEELVKGNTKWEKLYMLRLISQG